MSTNKLVWFQLVDQNGEPYKATCSSVSMSPESVVHHFRDAVKAKNSVILPGIVSTQLLVYSNREAFDQGNAPLDEETLVDGLGTSKAQALVVAVVDDSVGRLVPLQVNPREHIEYNKIAEVLKTSKKVKNFNSKIDELASKDNHPFILLGGSSGKGKTQMYFNLKQLRGDIHYIHIAHYGENSQKVYLPFKERSEVFLKCVTKDMKYLEKAGYAETLQGIKNEKLWVYGYMNAFLNNVEHIAPQKPPTVNGVQVVFLDEFPMHSADRHSDNSNRLRFIRNIFRSCGFVVIISSTNISALFLQNSSQSSRAGDPFLWCYVFRDFPEFNHPDLKSLKKGKKKTESLSSSNLRNVLYYIMKNSRPWFAHMVMNYYKTNKGEDNVVTFFDDMFKHIGLIARSKKSKNLGFNHGQVCLLLSAAYKNTEDKNALLVQHHYADLTEEQSNNIRF
jgi:hypothetical protein